MDVVVWGGSRWLAFMIVVGVVEVKKLMSPKNRRAMHEMNSFNRFVCFYTDVSSALAVGGFSPTQASLYF